MKTIRRLFEITLEYLIGLLVIMVAVLIVGFLARCIWETFMIGFNLL